jgi:hypothetical protein
MTNVLTFPRTRILSGSRRAAEWPPAAEQADILLFTGVRYERHAEDAPSFPAGSVSGRDDGQTPRRRKARRRA